MRNDFFRVGADGTPNGGDVTDTVIEETVVDLGDNTTTVEEEIPSLGTEDDISVTPETSGEEVTTETETVKPVVINQYPYPYGYGGYGWNGYGGSAINIEEPTVILESPNSNRSMGVPADSEGDIRRSQTRLLITWLALAALGLLLYRSMAKKA